LSLCGIDLSVVRRVLKRRVVQNASRKFSEIFAQRLSGFGASRTLIQVARKGAQLK
jgi:hypothetical protein